MVNPVTWCGIPLLSLDSCFLPFNHHLLPSRRFPVDLIVLLDSVKCLESELTNLLRHLPPEDSLLLCLNRLLLCPLLHDDFVLISLHFDFDLPDLVVHFAVDLVHFICDDVLLQQ